MSKAGSQAIIAAMVNARELLEAAGIAAEWDYEGETLALVTNLTADDVEE